MGGGCLCPCEDKGAAQRLLAMDVRTALSTSLETLHRSKEMMYSMNVASHGSVIGPSLGNPNSSSDILKSSRKMLLVRYSSGTMKRFPSTAYTKRWPLFATDVLQTSSSPPQSALVEMLFLLPKDATFCVFLAISMILFVLSIIGCE